MPTVVDIKYLCQQCGRMYNDIAGKKITAPSRRIVLRITEIYTCSSCKEEEAQEKEEG